MVDTSADALEALIEHSQDIIIVVDATGTTTFVNSAIEDMLGYDPDELVGTSAFDQIHPEDRDEVFERFNDLLETPGESTDRVQHRMLDSDGRVVWVESIGSNQTNTELDGYVINTRNITELKAYEAELKRKNERLDEFASVVSHDLRNPLNVAQSRLDLLRMECDSDHLAPIERSHERIEGLVDDLLTLARAGDNVGEVESVDFAILARHCWQNVSTPEATLELDVDVDRTIRADRSRLQQLLENLVRNAVEHGGDDVTVTVGDLADGFYVEDDGPGLPTDDGDDVFEPGYSTADEGTGFGLSIVLQIVEAHGWDIVATEGVDGGARFEIHGVGGD